MCLHSLCGLATASGNLEPGVSVWFLNGRKFARLRPHQSLFHLQSQSGTSKSGAWNLCTHLEGKNLGKVAAAMKPYLFCVGSISFMNLGLRIFVHFLTERTQHELQLLSQPICSTFTEQNCRIQDPGSWCASQTEELYVVSVTSMEWELHNEAIPIAIVYGSIYMPMANEPSKSIHPAEKSSSKAASKYCGS